MDISHIVKLSVFIHTLAGFIGLLFFWILIFKKKGTNSHKKIGQVFYYSLIVVCFTSILNGTIYLVADAFFYQNIKPHLGYGVVMILQGLLSVLPAYYGQLALKSIETLPSQKTLRLHIMYLLFLVLYVVINQFFAIKFNYFLLQFYSFSAAPLTIFLCLFFVYRLKKQKNSKKELLTSHIILSIVAGIAIHVGFFVGGFSTKFLLRSPTNTEYAGVIFGMVVVGVVYTETLRRRLK